MLQKQSADNDEAIRNDAEKDSVVAQATKPELTASPPKPDAPPNHRNRRLVIGMAGILVLVVALIFVIPWIRLTLTTVSTDDAYVNGHVTFVAARVGGQVARVLVDDNNRVHKGDVLVELDKEPLRDVVAVKNAAVVTAEADLEAARATVRGIEAQ